MLCLCGDSGLDIEEAKRKKMQLIGCDRNEDCVTAFRKKGGLAVVGDVMHTCGALDPDAVILDYTCDVSVQSVIAPLKKDGVIVFNFQRGRKSPGMPLPLQDYQEICSYTMKQLISKKHRGIYAAILRATVWLHNHPATMLGLVDNVDQVALYKRALSSELNAMEDSDNNHWNYIADNTKSLNFDSVMLRNRLFHNDWAQTVDAKTRVEYKKKLAPIKAHLTRRRECVS